MSVEEVKLPDIGEGVTEGEMVTWLVQVGDTIEVDQAVAEVMTDKATVEVPSPVAGTVKELKANEGDIIPIETTMLTVDTSGSGATASAPAPVPSASAPAQVPSTPAPAAAAPAPTTASTSNGSSVEVYPPVADSKVLATPGTRRLAREMSVDINGLQGTGLAGRVTREDVMKAKGAVSAGPAMPAPSFKTPPAIAYQGPAGAVEDREPLRGIRRKIAEQMQMTKQVVPHFTIMDEANVSELVKVRTQAKAAGEAYGVKVTYLPFVMKALIASLREFPMLNASIDDAASEVVYKKYYNLGFACDTPNGLMVPVIKDADRKTILQISQEIIELSTKARDGKLALEDMKGATISITNIGSVGGTYATPIINHPEVAILGMYKIEDKPLWKDGQWVPVKSMNFTATCDHRLIDGAVAANFLKAFISRIENPSRLMLDMI